MHETSTIEISLIICMYILHVFLLQPDGNNFAFAVGAPGDRSWRGMAIKLCYVQGYINLYVQKGLLFASLNISLSVIILFWPSVSDLISLHRLL